MKFAAEQPAAARGVTRRALLGGGLMLSLAGCNSAGLQIPNDGGGRRAFGRSASERSARRRDAWHGTGSSRDDPAADSGRGGKPDRRVDAERGPARDQRFRFDVHHAYDRGRSFDPRRCGAGGPVGTGRRRATDSWTRVRERRAVSLGGGKVGGQAMIAFSTDVSVAAPGVYLLSFLIQGYVDRILQYAVSTGKKSFAIMAPQNDYGNVAAQRFQDMAGNLNVQVVVTARYSSGQMATAASRWRRLKVRSTLFLSRSRRTRCRRSRRLSGRPASRPSFWARASGTTRGFSNCRRCRARGSRPRQFRLRRLRAALQGQVQQRSGSPRDARL